MTEVTVSQPATVVPPRISPDGRNWWDGRAWQPIAGPSWPPPSRAVPSEMPMVVIGYITAVLMPIVGLVLGIVAVTRPDPRVTRHGAWIIGLSALMFVVYVFVVLAVAGDTQPVLRSN